MSGLSFQHAKDELLKWLVPALLGGLFMQVSGLKDEQSLTNAKLVGLDRDISFHEFRLNKQSEAIVKGADLTNKMEVVISRLEQKVFKNQSM